ncbi:MAG: ribonuclease J [Dehalococcoidales bacterium]|jgi:ribonuclease J|nr:ribonuclease J [Dehalococcoidales bacterium]MDP6221280.1 ribonuclease J [Dehalococcoidales bacterium]MDP7110122.1 ribonuclease J [Dehalococcoidales bacterium]MDP7310091.1 ribonuclease J [Dehalococcoidales bacterium]MDP7409613.1 ribonuclease J [Dehalococcoidales bacterium]|tara:strand:- start:1288 stop:2946 length:1659 start_codon:yes stop_codon:yes gene_type:complete
MPKPKLKIVPLGGLGEIGKNMMVMEYDDDIIIIDAGLMFPEEDMLGIDLVIPDINYLLDKKEKIKGIIVTHGHEDHIGALPYILPQLNVPVYATKLTCGLISVKLKERKALDGAILKVIPPSGSVTLGKFSIEFFPVCHSIPDAVGLIIHTPMGIIVHTGDFKLDYTPVSGKPTDLPRLAQLGARGILLLLADSTYAERPGYTPSERVVGEALDRVIADAPGRVIVATFSSLVSRVQQVIDAAVKYRRRVFVVGRSMSATVNMALELGYLHAPEGVLARFDELRGLPHNKIVFVVTGSQGEPTSALVRMANRDHHQVHILRGDTVVLSATPIPGNEGLVNRTVDSLFKQGALVLYDKVAEVHVHGHASQEELKLLLNVTKPKFFAPVHGEYRHLTIHARLAELLGTPKANIFVMEDGDVLELAPGGGKVTGKVDASNVYVDGLGVGDINGVVLRDRRMLSKDGIVMVILTVDRQTGKLVGRPDIVSRGFVDTVDAKDMLEMSRDLVARVLGHGAARPANWGFITTKVRDTLHRFYYDQTRRRPMILSFMVKV